MTGAWCAEGLGSERSDTRQMLCLRESTTPTTDAWDTGEKARPLPSWSLYSKEGKYNLKSKYTVRYDRAFPGASVVRNRPAKQENWVRSLGQEDPLEEGMATHSSILAWRIPWTEEPSGLQSMAS